MRRLTFLLLICLPMSFLCRETASAQRRSSEPIRPRWIHKLPRPANTTFTYEIESASAATLDAARERCLAELVAHSGLESGVVIVSNNRLEERLSQVWDNGKLTERLKYDSHTTTQVQSDAVKLHIDHVAEYWERDRSGNYYVTSLYARSEPGQTPLFDHVELTTRYGARGLWRSMIIPGWGQFHKGANLKGGLILGGCAALAAGIVFTENQRSDYARKITRTHNTELINSYATRRDHFATARNICIGAVAALYVYNLIDAIAAPGAQRAVVRKQRHYAFMPAVSSAGDPLVAATFTF